MIMIPWKLPRFSLLLMCLPFVLGADEDNIIDLQTLLLNTSSSLKEFRQDLGEIEARITETLERFERQNVSDSLTSLNAKLDKIGNQDLDEIKKNFATGLDKLEKSFATRLDKLEIEVKKHGEQRCVPMQHCADVYDRLSRNSGMYTIQPFGLPPFEVYCDMTTDGGGWTVFQKRGDFRGIPVDNFYRGWQEYEDGFGDLKTEFWIGLSKLSVMTKAEAGSQELRLDMSDLDKNRKYAKYKNFRIEPAQYNFQLRIGNFSGDVGDSFKINNLQAFTTHDRDNDRRAKRNCAKQYSGGWWYNDCHQACLNGLNLKGPHNDWGKGIEWKAWKGESYSLSETEMKFRPMGWTPKK